MTNEEFQKVQTYMRDLGMSDEEINQQLANPRIAAVFLTSINKYEAAYHTFDPEEEFSTPFDSFSNAGRNDKTGRGK